MAGGRATGHAGGMSSTSGTPSEREPTDDATTQDTAHRPTPDEHPDPGPAGGPPPGASGGPRVTASEARDLARLRRTTGPWRRVAGVAGGVARHLDVDPLLVRVLFVVLTFFGGAGLVVYVACWLLVPEDGRDRGIVSLDDGSRALALVVVGAVGLLLLVGDAFGNGVSWPLAVVAGVVGLVLLARSGSSRPPAPPVAEAAPGSPGVGPSAAVPADAGTAAAGAPTTGSDPGSAAPGPAPGQDPQAWLARYEPPVPPPPPPDPRRRGPALFWGVMAAVLLGWGVLGTVDVTGTDVPGAAYPALTLATIGVGLVLGSVWGRAGGLVAVGLVATLALAVASVGARVDRSDTVLVPETAGAVPSSVDHAAGRYTLDLTEVVDLDELDGRRLDVRVGAGLLRVVVPEDLGVDVSGEVGLGSAELLGRQQDGAGLTVEADDAGGGDTTIVLDTHVGVGRLEVVQEGAR
jgi:phage shock protein PspC (stress-responsive transcriptional regulator)